MKIFAKENKIYVIKVMCSFQNFPVQMQVISGHVNPMIKINFSN